MKDFSVVIRSENDSPKNERKNCSSYSTHECCKYVIYLICTKHKTPVICFLQPHKENTAYFNHIHVFKLHLVLTVNIEKMVGVTKCSCHFIPIRMLLCLVKKPWAFPTKTNSIDMMPIRSIFIQKCNDATKPSVCTCPVHFWNMGEFCLITPNLGEIAVIVEGNQSALHPFLLPLKNRRTET